jgi:hypothetical protein
VCTHLEGYLQLRDGAIQVIFKALWKILTSRKLGKIGQTISQKLAFGPKHDIIQAQWASNISSKNMLKKVWWCRHSKIKFRNQTIYCSMNCSNKRVYARVGGSRKSHAALSCCWKGKMLLSIHAKASKRNKHWLTINLVVMIDITRAQLSK